MHCQLDPQRSLQQLLSSVIDEGLKRLVAVEVAEDVGHAFDTPAVGGRMEQRGLHEIRIGVDDGDQEVGRRFDRDRAGLHEAG